MGRDDINSTYNTDKYFKNSFPEYSEEITHQPRAESPAWMLRGLEQNFWNYLHKDPQSHTETPFDNNVSTRLSEKNKYHNQKN